MVSQFRKTHNAGKNFISANKFLRDTRTLTNNIATLIDLDFSRRLRAKYNLIKYKKFIFPALLFLFRSYLPVKYIKNVYDNQILQMIKNYYFNNHMLLDFNEFKKKAHTEEVEKDKILLGSVIANRQMAAKHSQLAAGIQLLFRLISANQRITMTSFNNWLFESTNKMYYQYYYPSKNTVKNINLNLLNRYSSNKSTMPASKIDNNLNLINTQSGHNEEFEEIPELLIGMHKMKQLVQSDSFAQKKLVDNRIMHYSRTFDFHFDRLKEMNLLALSIYLKTLLKRDIDLIDKTLNKNYRNKSVINNSKNTLTAKILKWRLSDNKFFQDTLYFSKELNQSFVDNHKQKFIGSKYLKNSTFKITALSPNSIESKKNLTSISVFSKPTMLFHNPLNYTSRGKENNIEQLNQRIIEIQKLVKNYEINNFIKQPQLSKNSMNPDISLNKLTDKVYHILERKIAIELERRG